MKFIKTNSTLDTISQKIQALNHLREKFTETALLADVAVEEISLQLAKEGLYIHAVSFAKTGMDSELWADGDSLRVEIAARATANKPFKFFAFRGYNASGDSYNRKAREAKAAKLTEKLLSVTEGVSNLSVNEFSLELKGDKNPEEKNVLISIWVKGGN